jgi:hypothetical protein
LTRNQKTTDICQHRRQTQPKLKRQVRRLREPAHRPQRVNHERRAVEWIIERAAHLVRAQSTKLLDLREMIGKTRGVE